MTNDEWVGLTTTPNNFLSRAANLVIEGRNFFIYTGDQFAEYFPENNTYALLRVAQGSGIQAYSTLVIE